MILTPGKFYRIIENVNQGHIYIQFDGFGYNSDITYEIYCTECIVSYKDGFHIHNNELIYTYKNSTFIEISPEEYQEIKAGLL